VGISVMSGIVTMLYSEELFAVYYGKVSIYFDVLFLLTFRRSGPKSSYPNLIGLLHIMGGSYANWTSCGSGLAGGLR